jgi:DNA-binding NtrC family response regulator
MRRALWVEMSIDTGRPRALVADDDADLLEIVTSIIDRFGVDVITASCGVGLLKTLIHEGPFDVIVTDVWMPRITGLHVVHSARAVGLWCPVIIMTALRDIDTTRQVSGLGEDVLLLRKPFSVGELHAALNESLAIVLH